MQSYTIYINYKKNKRALLNGSFGPDGSFYFSEMLSKYIEAPWGIMTFDFPINKVGRGMRLQPSSKYYVTRKPKMTHHKSGFFQISGLQGKSILSGEKNGIPRGVATNSFSLNQSTNDDGPTFTGRFWGLNYLPERSSKDSKEICFSESEINEQGFLGEGKRIGFVINIFHFPADQIDEEEKQSKEKWHKYKHFKRILRLKLIPSPNKNYFLGIGCMKARVDSEELTGCHLSGGPGFTDKKTGLCKNTAIIFPGQSFAEDPSAICLDNKDFKKP